MTIEIKPPPKKKLIVFPQDKGGIGKSFVATLLYDYLSERQVKLKTFDLDHANSTFQRYVAEAEFLDTDVDADKLAVLDKMVNALDTVDVVLVDNRASGGTKILRYIEDSQLTEMQKELQFELLFVVVVLEDKDAISQIADLLDEYKERVQWLVVRNYRETPLLTMFDGSQPRGSSWRVAYSSFPHEAEARSWPALFDPSNTITRPGGPSLALLFGIGA